MFDASNYFTKENLDQYLRELAKEYRKLNGKSMPAEIILIGGAAILINYGFRDMTTDVDAIIHASSSMKDAINKVGDRHNLPYEWLNADFMKTISYTPVLNEISVYYKTFSNVLTVRTVSAEYLIAMKLKSGRKYKNDLSDIVGILAEHQKRDHCILLEDISNAVNKLYGGWNMISAESKLFVEEILRQTDFQTLYKSIKSGEKETKEILLSFEQDYPGVTTSNNVNEILENLKKRR